MPLVAAAAWTRHADAIKAASPVTEWLTSSSLRRWNFGWPGQRIDPSAWYSILQHTVPSLLSLYAVLLVPAAIAAWRSTQRLFWLAVASAVVLPPLVFMNLYVNHDYYPAAISPAIAALLGLGCGWVRPWFGRGGSSRRFPASQCCSHGARWSWDEATGCESTAATTILR